MLQKDKGERKSPLLPSLREIVVVSFSLYLIAILSLCNAFMKRMEQLSTTCTSCWRQALSTQFL